MTVVCDDQNCITYFSSLYPGSVHDSRAFKSSSVGNNASEACYLNRYQYLLADSAYGITNCIISPFKKKKNGHQETEAPVAAQREGFWQWARANGTVEKPVATKQAAPRPPSSPPPQPQFQQQQPPPPPPQQRPGGLFGGLFGN